jgi:autotransporter-associated beta strand protein
MLVETGGNNFSGGITNLGGTLILDDINSAVTGGLGIASGATVQLGANDSNGSLPAGGLDDEGTLIFNRANALVVSTAIAGAGAVVQNGSGALTLAGPNTYTGNTTVNAGTLVLNNASSITNSAALVVNGATLDISSAAGSIPVKGLSLANATVNVALTNILLLQPLSISGSLTLGGSANQINVLALPTIAVYPTTFTLAQAAGGISGNNLSLGSLPAGYNGSLSENPANGTILLTLTSGPAGVRPCVLWSGADIPNLNTNWSDASNWQLPGVPTPVDYVIFGVPTAGASSVLGALGGGAGQLYYPQ